MTNRAIFAIFILMLGSLGYAQKRGSQELGGGISFWSQTDNDTSQTNLNLDGIWGYYIMPDFIFEFEPRLSLHFVDNKFDLTGLAMMGLAKRFMDLSNLDQNTGSRWARKYERSTAGIFGSVSGGLWAERSDNIKDLRIYVGPAMGLGLETRSQLGSLTVLRVKFQYLYLMPTPPVHEKNWSMFTISVGFSVISKL